MNIEFFILQEYKLMRKRCQIATINNLSIWCSLRSRVSLLANNYKRSWHFTLSSVMNSFASPVTSHICNSQNAALIIIQTASFMLSLIRESLPVAWTAMKYITPPMNESRPRSYSLLRTLLEPFWLSVVAGNKLGQIG